MTWETGGSGSLGGISTTWTLAVVAVGLRFFARRRSKAGLWYDDWLVIPAMVRVPYDPLS